MMSYDSDYKYAYDLYQKGVDAEGEARRRYLTQAKNVLQNVPDEWPGKQELLSKINYML